MKVRMEDNYKEYYTMADVDRAKTVIKGMKEDEFKPADYAEIAAQHIIWHAHGGENVGSLIGILRAEARTAKNSDPNAWNRYDDDTQNMDVWIDFVAECGLGFIKGGAYLTDIWSIGDDTDYTDKMFIRVYHE